MTQTQSASCLCGAVTLSIPAAARHVGACHCGTCRQWGGGPYLAIDCGTDVDVSGAESVTSFDSSEWARRSFCKRCGSHLFYQLKETGQTMVAAGLLTDQSELSLTHQVFIDKRPPFYELANETPCLTEAEVFEKFGGSN